VIVCGKKKFGVKDDTEVTDVGAPWDSRVYLLNKYIKCNFRGYRCGTTTIVDIRRQKVNDN